jgi:hypothetical protein
MKNKIPFSLKMIQLSVLSSYNNLLFVICFYLCLIVNASVDKVKTKLVQNKTSFCKKEKKEFWSAFYGE